MLKYGKLKEFSTFQHDKQTTSNYSVSLKTKRVYCPAKPVHLNSLGFEYAEVIANFMKVIFRSSKDIEIKKNALKINLLTAIYYNRYYAMGVFDDLLLSVKSDQEAAVVATMLMEEADAFSDRIDALPYKDLHVKVRDVIDFIKSKHKQEPKPFSFDDL